MIFPSDVRSAMRFFRSLGLNPVPSRPDKKAPMVRYRDHWAMPGPDWWEMLPAVNVQVMTGVAWQLAAIDLDGPMALEIWESWSMYRDTPPTWEVVRDPAQGRHLWFRLPANLAECRSRDLWSLDGAGHAKIEMKADRALIIAPPSRHVRTGQPYRFTDGHGPDSLPRPALLPSWLLSMPAIRSTRIEPVSVACDIPKLPRFRSERRLTNEAVLAAISDKASVAASWGLRIVGGSPDSQGWLPCRAIGREDRDPSASFNIRSGYYCEPATRERLSLFALGATIGPYDDWQSTRDQLGESYAVHN